MGAVRVLVLRGLDMPVCLEVGAEVGPGGGTVELGAALAGERCNGVGACACVHAGCGFAPRGGVGGGQWDLCPRDGACAAHEVGAVGGEVEADDRLVRWAVGGVSGGKEDGPVSRTGDVEAPLCVHLPSAQCRKVPWQWVG